MLTVSKNDEHVFELFKGLAKKILNKHLNAFNFQFNFLLQYSNVLYLNPLDVNALDYLKKNVKRNCQSPS
jgi:hypothetical protein